MTKLSEIIKVGDKITVYTGRGSNWRLPVTEVDDAAGTVTCDCRSLRNAWTYRKFSAKISARGIAYAEA